MKTLTSQIQIVKKLPILLLITFISLALESKSQVTHGVFGGDAPASGYAYPDNTEGKWVKLGELTLNGRFAVGGVTIDFFPYDAHTVNAKQQLSIYFANNTDYGKYSQLYELSLIQFHGNHQTIKDAKVVHTAGNGNHNNKLSIWVQMGVEWVREVPIEVHGANNTIVYLTPQPYYSQITENGTTYDVNTYYSMQGNQLEVNGIIRSKEIKIEASLWPDYVFEDHYDLKELSEVEKFIAKNGHLPNIPSAKEVENNGISVGEMNAKLLEKIEELTLYLIQQRKEKNTEIRQLNKRIEQLEKQ